MKRDNPAKHFIFAFAIALVGYVIVYHFIENRRTRKGPWHVTFTNTPAGEPEMIINQAALGISNVQIQFTNSTLTNFIPGTHSFSQPKPVPYEVPFGKCVFMDTTFQPGTITFQLYGHEIELLPRVLIVDRQERRWVSGESVMLSPSPPSEKSLAH
jgi:hypothetical protein